MTIMPVPRRPGLLLSAVVTITVPSMLAALALLGHEHGAATEVQAEATSLGASAPGAEQQSAAIPVELDAGPAPVRDAAAQMEGTAVSSFAATPDQQKFGMSLLSKAAAAGLGTTYEGVELIAQSGVTGTVTMISNVWHRDGLTVTQTSDATTVLADDPPYVAYNEDTRSPEGVFGLTETLVGLLGSHHYTAVATSTGSIVGRPARIVELHRADGSLAAKFWLDYKTNLPLRRDVFDESAQLISQDAFVQVQFGSLAAAPASVPPGASAWSRVTAPGQLLAALNGVGWELPATLPGNLSLYEAAQSRTGSGEVVDLGYSDGLSVISLFVQRGTLATKMTGWQPVSLNGHTVYVAEHSITWTGHGFVYTVIADAAPRTVESVIAALPQNSSPGFLSRIGRGLNRLATLVNPFR